ncbi:hypothetical protein MTO96_026686 [Rhipicephalus appendiculatus]
MSRTWFQLGRSERRFEDFSPRKRLLDTKCVVDSFDLLYSVITNFHSLDEKVIQDAFDLALFGCFESGVGLDDTAARF